MPPNPNITRHNLPGQLPQRRGVLTPFIALSEEETVYGGDSDIQSLLYLGGGFKDDASFQLLLIIQTNEWKGSLPALILQYSF